MFESMKVSIITVVLNNKETIKYAIDSVLSQTYKNIEYIVIDGASTDGTIEVIESYGDRISTFISEKDDGLYHAMNKGIDIATGNIIGTLNSDDFYANKLCISEVVNEFKNRKIDALFSDLVYVSHNNLEKVIRYYDSSHFTPSRFAYGWMPAHPTFFVKKDIYKKYGTFRTDLKIAADFDLMVRFLYTYKIKYHYMKTVLVKMRTGGISTSFSSIWIINVEVFRVCSDNGVKTNIFKVLSKYPAKIIGFFKA